MEFSCHVSELNLHRNGGVDEVGEIEEYIRVDDDRVASTQRFDRHVVAHDRASIVEIRDGHLGPEQSMRGRTRHESESLGPADETGPSGDHRSFARSGNVDRDDLRGFVDVGSGQKGRCCGG